MTRSQCSKCANLITRCKEGPVCKTHLCGSEDGNREHGRSWFTRQRQWVRSWTAMFKSYLFFYILYIGLPILFSWPFPSFLSTCSWINLLSSLLCLIVYWLSFTLLLWVYCALYTNKPLHMHPHSGRLHCYWPVTDNELEYILSFLHPYSLLPESFTLTDKTPCVSLMTYCVSKSLTWRAGNLIIWQILVVFAHSDWHEEILMKVNVKLSSHIPLLDLKKKHNCLELGSMYRHTE